MLYPFFLIIGTSRFPSIAPKIQSKISPGNAKIKQYKNNGQSPIGVPE